MRSVAAWQEAQIGAELAGLRLADVLVNVGDSVRRGQLLARLNSDTINVELAQRPRRAGRGQGFWLPWQRPMPSPRPSN